MKKRTFVLSVTGAFLLGFSFCYINHFPSIYFWRGPDASTTTIYAGGEVELEVEVRKRFFLWPSGPITYQWTDGGCGNGFTQSNSSRTTWLAPTNPSNSPRSCTIRIEARHRGTTISRSINIVTEPQINVVVLWGGDTNVRDKVVGLLNGVPGYQVRATTQDIINWNTFADLNSADVLVLLYNYNSERSFFHLASQLEIHDFVNNGGGLVTNGRVVINDQWANLVPIIPATPKSHSPPNQNAVSQIRFNLSQLNNALTTGIVDPSKLDFTMWTDVEIDINPNATAYYESDTFAPVGTGGLIGWDIGAGRVISFSVMNSSPTSARYDATGQLVNVSPAEELDTPDFAQLFINSVWWASQ